MGGLGKTTLAKKVSNDTDVQHDFSCRAWVYVSQEYNIRELLLGIANCVTTLTDEQKRKMKTSWEKRLKMSPGKRYLIVLDDLGAVSQQSRENSKGDCSKMQRFTSCSRGARRTSITERSDTTLMSEPCFLYCGVFPEDSEIKASKLIRLWVAEGFVQKRGKETLEDIAEDYLNELIQRSMIQVADTRDDGRVKSCRIHDLLRDLAISEAKEEKFLR
ncbi:hypothetical protein AAG906_027422 [Vitis piasezkii]